MIFVELEKLEIRKRQRTTIAPGPLNELKQSILGRGLLHAPVAWFDDITGTYVLIAGERRATAIREIAKEGKSFIYGDESVPPGMIPLVPHTLDDLTRFEAELDENIHRVDLDWQDRARALADLHSRRMEQNPGHTRADTAREIVQRGTQFTTEMSAAKAIRQAVIIAEHLHDPKIQKARNGREAAALIYKQEDERVRAALARRVIQALPERPDIEVRKGDLLQCLPALDADSFDLIIADPPYGIGASGDGFRGRTVLHHNYDDTKENAEGIAQCILVEGFRVCKKAANIFMFCDIDLFPWLKRTAANMGWVPFRRPLVWQKSDSEGLAPWGANGPRITTEYIFYATKGQRGLSASPIDVFRVNRVPRHERIHAAEKPVELIRKLIECSTLAGDSVLDPCCGSGSTLVACKELKRRGLGIEKDPDYVDTATANVYGDKAP